MKNNIKGILAGLLVSITISGCNTEKVMTFEPNDCVYFAIPTDTSRFSFAMLENPSVGTHIFTIDVDLAGSPTPEKREFYVDVIDDVRNSQTKYEIVQPSILEAGGTTGTIEIKVWRTENLSVERDTITVRLKGSGDLIAEFEYNSTRCITFYDRIDKPDWWSYVHDYYLGQYHDIKMQILQIVTGSMDDPLSSSLATLYMTFLNKYCEENNVKYPGTDNDVRFAYGY